MDPVEEFGWRSELVAFLFSNMLCSSWFSDFQIHLPGLCNKPFLSNKKYNDKNAMSQNSFSQTILHENDANNLRKY